MGKQLDLQQEALKNELNGVPGKPGAQGKPEGDFQSQEDLRKKIDLQLPIALIGSLDIKQAFELYSYRLINQDDFIQRVKEICKRVNKEL